MLRVVVHGEKFRVERFCRPWWPFSLIWPGKWKVLCYDWDFCDPDHPDWRVPMTFNDSSEAYQRAEQIGGKNESVFFDESITRRTEELLKQCLLPSHRC